MRKTLIACLIISTLATGCATKYIANGNSPVIVSSNMSDTTSSLSALSSSKAPSSSQAASSTAPSKTVSTKTVMHTALVQAVTSSGGTSSMTGTQTIALNVSSQNDLGTMNFTSVKIDYDNQAFTIYFTIQMSSNTQFLPQTATCEDKNGTNLKPQVFGEQSKTAIKDSSSSVASYQYSGGIGFGYSDVSALSTITLTYQFQGASAVTITINIPGIQA